MENDEDCVKKGKREFPDQVAPLMLSLSQENAKKDAGGYKGTEVP